MTDNVAITAGSGTSIATEDIGGVHFQKVINYSNLSKTNATGSAAISASASITTASRLMSVTLHLSSAPTTAGSLTVTLNANAGAGYDTLLLSQSLVGITDLVWQPDADILLESGDAIDTAYANTDGRTYGIQITVEVRG
jgi:hypothetical protein